MHSKEPIGLGGWLILFGLGLVLAPLEVAVGMVTDYAPLFTEDLWQARTTPGSEAYIPNWSPLIIYEILGNVALLAAAIALLFLFFTRSRLFPKTYIIVVILNLLYLVIDALWASLVFTGELGVHPLALRDIGIATIAVLVWVPYILHSRRVANTFGPLRQIDKTAAA